MISLGLRLYYPKANINSAPTRQLLTTSKGQWKISHILISTNPTNYIKTIKLHREGVTSSIKEFLQDQTIDRERISHP